MAKKKNVEKAPREMTHRQLSLHKRQQRRQRIIFISGVSIIAAVVIIVIAGWLFSEYLPLHRTVFKVYDTEISMNEFVDTLKIVGLSNNVSVVESMAGNVANEIIRNELLRHGGEQLRVSISDEEVKKAIQSTKFPVNKAAINLFRAQMLPGKLKNDYFAAQVPVSDNQVYIMAMMVEDDSLVPELRSRLVNGDNFTLLAEEYAQNYTSKKVNKGDFGWHPASILMDLLGSSIPIDFAFNAEPGTISEALPDTESFKQLGYWLIRVNDKPVEGSANISAILASSAVEAKSIRAKLEAGDILTELADTYSQYSPSKEGHGELGILEASENISDAFNGYAFNPETELGKWSNPIREVNFWTRGGAWLVKVIDKEENRKLSDEDRNSLINKDYDNWVNGLWVAASADIMNDLSDEQQRWAVDRAIRELQKS